MAAETDNRIAAFVIAKLTPYLGKHTARSALNTFTMRALQRGPETLTPADVPALCNSLRPMMQTFIGEQWSEVIITSIMREVGS